MLNVLRALHDADAFAVATMAEGVALRHSGESKPILVLQGFRTTDQLYDCMKLNLWPVVHSRFQLDIMANHTLERLSCWVKFDTGMARTGFEVQKAATVHRRLQASSVEVVGILSHLACAGRAEELSNERQLREFNAIKWPQAVDRSLANSAALVSRKEMQLDWVRPGPAMRATAPVIAVRDVRRGQRIGYGGRFLCPHNMTVAVIGAGYGDGYPRSVPDGTAVMLGNKRCPLVGRISMDSMVVDISSLTVPPPIDYPVTLWGHSQLPVDEIAALADTIAYETLCCVRGQVTP